MSIKQAIKKICPKLVWTVLQKIKQLCIRITGKRTDIGQRVSLGKLNPHKVFYVIRTHGYSWGALTTWILIMPHILFAKKKKYVPIFDFLNVNGLPMLLDKEDERKKNAWELYFEQPQKQYSLEEILHSKKVIITESGCPEWTWTEEILNANLPIDDEQFNIWRSMYEICPFNSDIISYAEQLKKKLFPKDKKILAVSYRRSFEWHHYWQSELTPTGSHLIRGSLSSIIDEVKKELFDYGYEYFFFTVDDREALTVMRETFGGKCISTERVMPHFFENNQPIVKDNIDAKFVEYGKRDKDVYLRAKEYLADVYLCSQCDSFLSCGSSADFMAYLINNKNYEHFVQLKGEGDTKTHGEENK
ncbi:MAG: hypothetical protein ACI4LX_05590 [Treponema sp.]